MSVRDDESLAMDSHAKICQNTYRGLSHKWSLIGPKFTFTMSVS
jgi:hypothetical protein